MTHVKQTSSSKATQSAFASMVPFTQCRFSARISAGDARGFLSFRSAKNFLSLNLPNFDTTFSFLSIS
jgi:hypothetical protein